MELFPASQRHCPFAAPTLEYFVLKKLLYSVNSFIFSQPLYLEEGDLMNLLCCCYGFRKEVPITPDPRTSRNSRLHVDTGSLDSRIDGDFSLAAYGIPATPTNKTAGAPVPESETDLQARFKKLQEEVATALAECQNDKKAKKKTAEALSASSEISPRAEKSMRKTSHCFGAISEKNLELAQKALNVFIATHPQFDKSTIIVDGKDSGGKTGAVFTGQCEPNSSEKP
jgi:hypothetical protein